MSVNAQINTSAVPSAPALEWLTAAEAAAHLKVKVRTILKWAKAGTIPAHPLHGCARVTWRFLRSELDDAMLQPASAAGTRRIQ